MGPKVTTSSSSCLRLVLLVVMYYCNTSHGKNMCAVWNWTRVDRPCIICLLSREKCITMTCVVIQNMTGTLIAGEEYTMIMHRVSRLNVAIYV